MQYVKGYKEVKLRRSLRTARLILIRQPCQTIAGLMEKAEQRASSGKVSEKNERKLGDSEYRQFLEESLCSKINVAGNS